jgi:serine/threonine protein kinase
MLPNASLVERYEVLRELSANGSGTTCKASVRAGNRTIALRVLLPGVETCPDLAILLENATRALRLNSPFIVRLCEAYENEGSVVLVSDYAEGSVLSSAIGSSHISDWDLVDASRQVCSAIDHAASLNQFHMNLHPANVIQEWDGTVKLLDYGVTVDVVRRAQANPVALEALRYISPEQASGAVVDRRSNLFSWGAMLYEMVTGKKAFPGDQAQAVLESIKNATPAPAHLAKPGVNPRLSVVLAKAMAKTPGDRYQTGAEMLHGLEHYRDTPAEPPKAVAPPKPPAPPKPVAPIAPVAAVVVSTETTPKPPVPKPPAPGPAPQQTLRPAATVAGSTPTKRVEPKQSPTAPAPRLKPTPVSEFLIIGSKSAGAEPEPSHAIPAKPSEPPAPSTPATPKSPAPRQATPEPAAPDVLPQATQPQAKSEHRRVAIPITTIAISAAAVACVLIVVTAAVFISHGKKSTPNLQVRVISQPTPVISGPAPEPTAAPPEAPVDEPSKAMRGKKKSPPVVVAAPMPVTGSLLVGTTPMGANIEIDGQQVQFSTPHTIANLVAGSHAVRVSKAGYEALSRTVQVQAGQTASLSLQLAELRATVVIGSSPPGASIAINGENSGRTTPVTVALLKGKYAISLTKDGYLTSDTTLDAVSGQTFRLSPQLTRLGNAEAVKEVGRFKKIFGGGDANMGKVQFRTSPKGAQISVNGRTMKKSTPADLLFPGGHYEVVFTLRGFKPSQKTITVTEGSTLEVNVQLEPGR